MAVVGTIAIGPRSGSSWTSRISHIRLTISPFTSEDMANVGEAMIKVWRTRINAAVDANDNPARPLVPKYERQKLLRGKAPARDWVYTTRTMAALKVKSANENQARVGFVTDLADLIVGVQNKRCKMWGMSPKDDTAYQRILWDLLWAKARAGQAVHVERLG